MSFLDRLSTGWKLAMSSFKILRANTQLLIFPVLSSVSLILIFGSFSAFLLMGNDWDFDTLEMSRGTLYLLAFAFYLVNYTAIIFFNMALIHCTRLYLQGEEPTVSKGLAFSASRFKYILSWAAVAATVGVILKAIQENSGLIGKIITGIVGWVWTVATFFVIPIIAYENVGPIDALKRSTEMMRAKWGESLGAGFSFGLINFLAVLLICVPLFFLGFAVHVFLGIALALSAFFFIMAVMSAAKVVFLGAIYHNLQGNVSDHFDQQLVDSLFVSK